MKRLLFLYLALMLFAACTPTSSNPDQTSADPNQAVSNSNEPPSIDAPTPPLKFDNTIPRPADKALRRENVYVDSIDLLTMESYPPQFMLVITGNLPTPCNQLRVNVNPPDANNKIVVEVYSVIAPDATCTEVLQPFEQSIPLGSFPSGHYTIWVNEEQVAEFDA